MNFTLKQFNDRFPTSDACLEELKAIRYADWSCPNCGSTNLSKIKGRAQYASPCGHQVAPLAGAIFHKSSTDLRTWFMTMYMMTQTRSGVSAKTIERTTGVTYKTAWRMMKQIRSLMNEGGDLLTGIVQVDEAYIGANPRKDVRLPRGKQTSNAEILFGATDKGTVKVRHIPNMGNGQLLGAVMDTAAQGSIVHSDGLMTYRRLNRMGYRQDWVDHSKGQCVRKVVATQQVENFWGVSKRGFKGSYIHCGAGYLQSYANEYVFRYSNRENKVPMFELLLGHTSIIKPV